MKKGLYVSLVIVALLCLVGWTVHAQLQRSSPAKQAWEYKSLVFRGEGRQYTLYEDGKIFPGSATPITRAPELGAQGWELVSVAGTENNTWTTYVYWFKRPK